MTHYNYGPEGYGYEMSEKERPWPSQSGSLSGSHPSLYSFYTPSNSTYILPIAQELPDLSKKTDDYMGFAICSLLVNPLFGIFAILASEKSKECYYRCSYRKARQYGQYAKGFALGGIIVMIIVYFLIGFAAFHHYRRFYMW